MTSLEMQFRFFSPCALIFDRCDHGDRQNNIHNIITGVVQRVLYYGRAG